MAENPPTPWLNVHEAAAYGRVGRRVIYKAIAASRLRAAHIDGRRKIVIRREWIDAWLSAAAPDIIEIKPKGTPHGR